jgi:hypothetical protein
VAALPAGTGQDSLVGGEEVGLGLAVHPGTASPLPDLSRRSSASTRTPLIIAVVAPR